MTQGRLGARETVLALAIGVFIAHASLLANWVVDDAGITFAYARNLARGHGLVSQPGLPPVEGFSNPLWTLVIAALYAMGLFTPVVSKVVGGVLVVATMVLIWADLRRRGASALGMAVPLLLIAACTPFVVWTTSGLENALLAFLVVAGALLAIRAAEAPSMPVRTDVAAGLMAGLTAMTRPDAVVYAALYPATVLLARVRAEGLRAILRRWLAFGAASAGVYGGYLAFRLGYYRQWFPNTFYAKQKPSLTMATRRKLIDLLESASGDLWPLVVVLLGIVVGWLLVTGRLRARTAVLMGYLGVSVAVFLVLPFDWMGELRFATACFPLFFWVLSASAQDATASGSSVVLRRAVLAGTALFVAQAIPIFAARTLAFASDPTLPLDDVEAYGGDGFNRLAEVAGVADASLLTPDVGGALLKSRLRIFDLGGLCDERIARSMSSGRLTDLHRYVFEAMRPTFIHTHGEFSRITRLYEDPRLERDYVAVYEHLEGPAAWAARWRAAGVAPPWSGDYIRREAVSPETLQAVRMEYRRLGLQRFLPWIGPEDRRRAGWPQAVWALETIRREASAAYRSWGTALTLVLAPADRSSEQRTAAPSTPR